MTGVLASVGLHLKGTFDACSLAAQVSSLQIPPEDKPGWLPTNEASLMMIVELGTLARVRQTTYVSMTLQFYLI